MNDKEKLNKLEIDMKKLETLLLNHIGDGADAHALSEEGLAGFISSEEKTNLVNALGKRTRIREQDFRVLPPGKYEGSSMLNGPISELNDGILDIDVTEGENRRRLIDVVKSSNGQTWQQVTHTNGVIVQDWARVLKAFGKRGNIPVNLSLSAAQRSKISVTYYLMEIPNFFDIVNLTVSIEPGAIPKNAVSPLIITTKFPEEVHPKRVLRDIYPDLTTPSSREFWVAAGFISASSEEFRINFDSSLDHSNKAYKIDRMYVKDPSINIG